MTGRSHWTDRLSAYVDGDMGERERAACDAHLAACRECAGAVEGLRALVAQASLLPEIPTSRDLWPAIESRLEPRGELPSGSRGELAPTARIAERRRWIVSMPQLVAAAIALVVLTAGGMWLMLPGGAEPVPVLAGADTGVEEAAPSVVFLASYEPALAELEAEYEARSGLLDPQTRRVVEENLAIIDRAIAEADRALAEDPSNAFLTTHLAGTMNRKVDLLRRATSIQSIET
jgi:anti-sigma factor RsiW